MHVSRLFNGLGFLLALAALGAVLLYAPPYFLRNYQLARDLGPHWATAYLVVVSVGGMLLLGATGVILFRLWRHGAVKREVREQAAKNPSALSTAEQQQEIARNVEAVAELQRDAHVASSVRGELAGELHKLEAKQTTSTLEIVAFGTVSSGKSSLLNTLAGREVFAVDARGGTTVRRGEVHWPGLENVRLVDTPGLGEIGGEAHVVEAAQAAHNADVVLLVVDGPLRDHEFTLLRKLGDMEKRVLVCLNKEDWFDESSRSLLVGQLTAQLANIVPEGDVVPVRAQAATRLRKRVLASGEEADEQIELPPNIAGLAERLLAIVRGEGPRLLLANLLLQSRGLVEESRRKVRAALDGEAWRVVEAHAWGAGGAAALSPFPLVDVAAGSAIAAKMVVELAGVYRQQMDLTSAVKLLGQLGHNLVGILGVNLATPAIVSLVASLVKTVPGVGTLAGGAVQGLAQALITRWIGGVFMEYFRNEMQWGPQGLASVARREWQRLTTLDELRKLALAARERFREPSA